MNSSLYIGATGMKGLADGMQVTTNNLANISTIGYKKQDILFSDLISQTQANMGDWWNAQEGSLVAIGQKGMGLQIESVRTSYQTGAIQGTNTMTDLAIDGKGFFQVSDGEKTFYTRAGDFRPDAEGIWRTPSGLALNGYNLAGDGELAPVQVDKFSTMPAQATASISASFNLSSREDLSSSEENPYFGLLEKYDATSSKPLDSGSYTLAQPMTVYDSEGNSRTVTAYFDGAPSSGSSRFMEFLIASQPANGAGSDLAGNAGEGLLMSGVLEFDSAGKLINVSAFTPQEGSGKDLSQWTTAEMVEGNPAFNLDGSQMSLNFGLSAAGGWANAPANAAAVGADASALPGLGADAIEAAYPTTAFSTSAMTNSYRQDGFAEGVISNITISGEGVVVGKFSNGQNVDLWQIPVCRFTSEDGLRREGGNLFSATEESGQMDMGEAGSENYGNIRAYNIEGSNVDMAQEMVNMIITQRGFQSNSKVVTTADQMLQKAMELKR